MVCTLRTFWGMMVMLLRSVERPTEPIGRPEYTTSPSDLNLVGTRGGTLVKMQRNKASVRVLCGPCGQSSRL